MSRAQTAADSFIIELDRFHGPLDLLLHLIREQDIGIFDIPVAEITEQFLQAIRGVERLGLDRAGEFLELAATLVRLKAQMLLPSRSDGAAEAVDPRAELVQRLLEYEHYREAARRLADAEADRLRHFGRGYAPPRPAPEPARRRLQLDWGELWAGALSLGSCSAPFREHHVRQRAVPLEEKIVLITEALERLARIEFGRLVAPFGDRLHTVMTLLAGLELTKRRVVTLRQRRPFTQIGRAHV